MIPGRALQLTVLVVAHLLMAGCDSAEDKLSASEEAQIRETIRRQVTETYDLARPGAVERLLSLYPESGPVFSTSSGHVSKSRGELEQQIRTFWQYVGSNMRSPKWEWTSMHIDVLSRDAAVLTASYRIPHLTPRNTPHVIAGAWTAAFVKRNGRWVVIQEHLSDVPAAQTAAQQPADHTGH